jgi:hypothetical protein
MYCCIEFMRCKKSGQTNEFEELFQSYRTHLVPTVGGDGGKNGLRYSDHGISGSVPARRAGGTFPATRQGYSYQPHAPF